MLRFGLENDWQEHVVDGLARKVSRMVMLMVLMLGVAQVVQAFKSGFEDVSNF